MPLIHNNNHIFRLLITIIFVVLLFFCLPYVCGHGHSHENHGHSHEHHGHSHEHQEPPSFKWSKEANEPNGAKNEQSNHINKMPDSNNETKQTGRPNLWLEALGSTLVISIAPYLILFFIPISNTKEHEPYLKILLAFASGGLLGDAFLHLIPHALMSQGNGHSEHSHSHSHSHSKPDENPHSHQHDTTIGVSVLGGIIVFLVVEKFVRIFKGGHSHSHHAPEQDNTKLTKEKSNNGKQQKEKPNEKSKSKMKLTPEGNMKVAGYLNLAADFTHNFTDGLAIGASFLAGRSVGIVTTFTIFLHEIPHEIGDFAILLQSGCSRRKAMLLQLITAFGALTGTCVSLMAEGSGDSAVSWILPFTAGGFIYIATVSVIPELLENSHFWQSVMEVTALLLGVALMMMITWVEELGHV